MTSNDCFSRSLIRGVSINRMLCLEEAASRRNFLASVEVDIRGGILLLCELLLEPFRSGVVSNAPRWAPTGSAFAGGPGL